MLEIEKIDWKNIRRELDHQEWDEVEPGIFERQVFLGTVSYLTPSGKYYAPFASSNITEAKADKDALWRIELETATMKRGFFVTNGEDPCDIMIVERKDNGRSKKKMIYQFDVLLEVDEEKTVARPEWIAKQIKEQIEKGIEIGLGESDIPILKTQIVLKERKE